MGGRLLKPYWVTIGFRALMAGAKGMYDGRGYMKRRPTALSLPAAKSLSKSKHRGAWSYKAWLYTFCTAGAHAC
jgi:hypothetical protein